MAGEVHCDDRPNSDYDLSLCRLPGVSVGVDASAMGNHARFVNDFRGIAIKPNALFVDTRTASGEIRIGIWSNMEIKKGEEILVSYGKSWWRSRAHLTWLYGMSLRFTHLRVIDIKFTYRAVISQSLIEHRRRHTKTSYAHTSLSFLWRPQRTQKSDWNTNKTICIQCQWSEAHRVMPISSVELNGAKSRRIYSVNLHPSVVTYLESFLPHPSRQIHVLWEGFVTYWGGQHEQTINLSSSCSLVPESFSSTCLRDCPSKVSRPSLHLIAAYVKPLGFKPVLFLFTAPSLLDRSLWLWAQETSLTR